MIETPKSYSIIYLLLLCCVLGLGFFMPLHPDEIDWVVVNGRAVLDNFQTITLYPQCQVPETFSKPLPFSWYPHAFLNYLLYLPMDHLWWIRGMAMARFVLLIAVCSVIIRRLSPALNMAPCVVFSFFMTLMLSDAMPLQLMVNRPEQTIILNCALLIALTLSTRELAQTAVRKYTALGVFVFTVLCLFPAHPKATALLPLALVCTAIFMQNLWQRRWLTLASVGLVGSFSIEATLFWLERVACPHSEEMAKKMLEHSPHLSDIIFAPLQFIGDQLGTFINALLRDFILQFPTWLPFSAKPLPDIVDGLAHADRGLVILLQMGMFFYCARFCVRMLMAWGRGRTLSSLGLLAFAACASLLGIMLIVGSKRTFYLSTLEIPLLYLCTLLCAAASASSSSFKPSMCHIRLALVMAVLGVTFMFARYSPYITEPATRERWEDWRNFSRLLLTSQFKQDARVEDLRTAYAACGFAPIEQTRHLVVDTYLYPWLNQGYQPFILTYFSDGVNGLIIGPKAFKARLVEYASDGVIASCQTVPYDYMPFFSRHVDICCFNPAAQQ